MLPFLFPWILLFGQDSDEKRLREEYEQAKEEHARLKAENRLLKAEQERRNADLLLEAKIIKVLKELKEKGVL